MLGRSLRGALSSIVFAACAACALGAGCKEAVAPTPPCPARTCPIGGNVADYSAARAGMDISAGAGTAVSGASGQAAFSVHGEAACRFQCVYPSCEPGTAPVITSGKFECYSPCERIRCPTGTMPSGSFVSASGPVAPPPADAGSDASASGTTVQSSEAKQEVRVSNGQCTKTCAPIQPCNLQQTYPVVTEAEFRCEPLPACPPGQVRGANGCAPIPAPNTPPPPPAPVMTTCEVKDCGVTTKTACHVSCAAPKQAKCSCDACGATLGVVTCLKENCRCE